VICTICGHEDTRVLESRLAEGGEAIRRRRECLECRARFTTFERGEEPPLWVVKRDGDRQLFDRGKLLRGLERACTKRPVAGEQVETVALRVEAELRADGGREVASGEIGEAALRHLRELDGVAYVRFASVYRQFDDVEEFQAELDLLDDAGAPAPRTYVR
jgi:transcriptional repressor NrdR